MDLTAGSTCNDYRDDSPTVCSLCPAAVAVVSLWNVVPLNLTLPIYRFSHGKRKAVAQVRGHRGHCHCGVCEGIPYLHFLSHVFMPFPGVNQIDERLAPIYQGQMAHIPNAPQVCNGLTTFPHWAAIFSRRQACP